MRGGLQDPQRTSSRSRPLQALRRPRRASDPRTNLFEDDIPRRRGIVGKRYPNDRAVDFVEGEIRGWCWVEMPKPKR
jgi:hypothetical protein